jgi:hypothetical protein
VIYDVRIVPPGQTEKSDAVAIDLDHRDGMSVIMYFPYRLTSEKKVIWGELFASKGSNDIFPRKNGG